MTPSDKTQRVAVGVGEEVVSVCRQVQTSATANNGGSSADSADSAEATTVTVQATMQNSANSL